MCGIRFTHGEARLQQWGNRQTNNHYVHAHCVNGGLGHDHELHPKLADDQEAVDAVTRQRDTITRTAADTEVLLPFAQDPDQASTAAPPDDERDLFGREQALRMDEDIMDFQWFEHVTWDSIKDLRGTTYVQPPTRFRFALQQAQHAILRAIVHNNPTSPASESAWKALVLSSWLLLGRPAVNASESNCAHYLDKLVVFVFFCGGSPEAKRVSVLCGFFPAFQQFHDATQVIRTEQHDARRSEKNIASARPVFYSISWCAQRYSYLGCLAVVSAVPGISLFLEALFERSSRDRCASKPTAKCIEPLLFSVGNDDPVHRVAFASTPGSCRIKRTPTTFWSSLSGVPTCIGFPRRTVCDAWKLPVNLQRQFVLCVVPLTFPPPAEPNVTLGCSSRLGSDISVHCDDRHVDTVHCDTCHGFFESNQHMTQQVPSGGHRHPGSVAQQTCPSSPMELFWSASNPRLAPPTSRCVGHEPRAGGQLQVWGVSTL